MELTALTKKQLHTKAAIKEKHEYPWATWPQAERIALDHKKLGKK
jgi:hypothetical protein